MNFYNDNDPKICAWLRELIKSGLIPDGVVDSRSIELINPDELKRFTQCHFFAGIGGWSEALRLAGWPVDAPVWTGSCPCQPYSCAGKGKGNYDPRNVWPHFRNLIAACKPPVVFGEQVASKAGREWLAGVFADLEALGYSRAGADLCAAGVGAPHIRQRLYWLAVSQGEQCNWSRNEGGGWRKSSDISRLVNPPRNGPEGGSQLHREYHGEISGGGCESLRLGKSDSAGSQSWSKTAKTTRHWSSTVATGFWSDYEILSCLDGKSRRTRSGVCPLAHGVQERVVRLRGYGNAIVPQIAAQFVSAFMDISH